QISPSCSPTNSRLSDLAKSAARRRSRWKAALADTEELFVCLARRDYRLSALILLRCGLRRVVGGAGSRNRASYDSLTVIIAAIGLRRGLCCRRQRYFFSRLRRCRCGLSISGSFLAR